MYTGFEAAWNHELTTLQPLCSYGLGLMSLDYSCIKFWCQFEESGGITIGQLEPHPIPAAAIILIQGAYIYIAVYAHIHNS